MKIFLLCLKIFFARILDVSLGTVRTIVTVKGKKIYAALIGFIEVFIWFLVARDALNVEVNNIFIPFSYSLGYATGTLLGGFISEKVISGNLTVQIVLSNQNTEIIDIIREKGYAVSVIDAKGQNDDKKYMLFMEINKNKLNTLKELIKDLDNKAFIVVNETKMVQNGYLK